MEKFGEDDEYVSRILEDDSLIKCLFSIAALYTPLYEAGLYKDTWTII